MTSFLRFYPGETATAPEAPPAPPPVEEAPPAEETAPPSDEEQPEVTTEGDSVESEAAEEAPDPAEALLDLLPELPPDHPIKAKLAEELGPKPDPEGMAQSWAQYAYDQDAAALERAKTASQAARYSMITWAKDV